MVLPLLCCPKLRVSARLQGRTTHACTCGASAGPVLLPPTCPPTTSITGACPLHSWAVAVLPCHILHQPCHILHQLSPNLGSLHLQRPSSTSSVPAVPGCSTLSVTTQGITTYGSCLLLDGSTQISGVESAGGYTYGHKTVKLPQPWSPPPPPQPPPSNAPRPRPPPPSPRCVCLHWGSCCCAMGPAAADQQA